MDNFDHLSDEQLDRLYELLEPDAKIYYDILKLGAQIKKRAKEISRMGFPYSEALCLVADHIDMKNLFPDLRSFD